jgi:uncharacterized protein YggE
VSSQPLISVKGEATLEVDPEIAVVNVTVMARDKDRHAAMKRLAARNEQILALIKALGPAVEKVESAPASIWPEFKEAKAREHLAGYAAQAGVTVTIGDFSALGELVPRLAGEELVTVTGPWWRLRPDSPVTRQARLSAARDAMTRAAEYAEAFGGRITGLVEAADPGLMGGGPEPARRIMAAGFAGAALESGGTEFTFEPVRQTVRAEVDARFTMTAPEFSG